MQMHQATKAGWLVEGLMEQQKVFKMKIM